MSTSQCIVNNYVQVRQDSIVLWQRIETVLTAEANREALSTFYGAVGKMLSQDITVQQQILRRGNIAATSDNVFLQIPAVSLEDALRRAQPYRERLLQLIYKFSNEELANTEIFLLEKDKSMPLGQYLLQYCNHEACEQGRIEMTYLGRVAHVDKLIA